MKQCCLFVFILIIILANAVVPIASWSKNGIQVADALALHMHTECNNTLYTVALQSTSTLSTYLPIDSNPLWM